MPELFIFLRGKEKGKGEGRKCTCASNDVDVTVVFPLGRVMFQHSSEASRLSYDRRSLQQQGLLLIRGDFKLPI